mmetsp:Transcript_10150/g.8685  ORF Transcript_10150/g.8685 Transcript_10150/m.8685 type:complete len:113 (-) Transcript_10150:908-1246(-)
MGGLISNTSSSQSTPINFKQHIQGSNIIRPVKVTYDSNNNPIIPESVKSDKNSNNDTSVSSGSFSSDQPKSQARKGGDFSNKHDYKRYHPKLSINIPGPNSEKADQPNSKGD